MRHRSPRNSGYKLALLKNVSMASEIYPLEGIHYIRYLKVCLLRLRGILTFCY